MLKTSEPIWFERDRNDIVYVEVRGPGGELIERRVTYAEGRAIEDVHFAYSSSKKTNQPSKYTTNTRIKTWGSK